MGEKRKNMEDEMSRFEAEIATPPVNMFIPSQVKQQPIINSSTYSQVQQKLSSVPPPPVPPMIIPPFTPPVVAQPQQIEKSYSTEPTPVVLSSAPKLYTNRPSPSVSAPAQPAVMDISSLQFEVTTKLKKLKTEKPSGPNPIAEAAIQAAKASSALQNFGHEDRKGKKNRKTIRMAGGQVWEDPSLADWPDDDFRIFCGDLGNDVNDELLTRTFNKYPSFQKAKVLRDKRTGKSKGFGFISFKEPQDFIRAMKEMDGRYVGSRPIKLRKSTWRARSVDVVKKKEQEKKMLQQLFKA
ncbi:RNA-binding protein 42 [Phlebotomus papatasi]|uniref:RNA-binding protein 42 n=1 Tax=Phlebotomus papatasi TaxID=29031 RepID=UPI00248360F5|nr:RNA-binding protein 42 [Phlebotomus papatasi]